MFKKLVLISIVFFAAHAFALNDQEIVKVVLTANEGEADMAKMAEKKGQAQAVKDFAKMMKDAHNQNTEETKSLAKKEKIYPKKSDISKNIEKDAKTWMKDLKKAEGSSFDKTYMDTQITAHKNVLSTFDEKLIPQATNAMLKDKLMKTRAAVAEHLSHAQDIQAKLQ